MKAFVSYLFEDVCNSRIRKDVSLTLGLYLFIKFLIFKDVCGNFIMKEVFQTFGLYEIYPSTDGQCSNAGFIPAQLLTQLVSRPPAFNPKTKR